MFLWKVGTFEISNDCESDMQQSEIVVLTLLLPMGTRRCKMCIKVRHSVSPPTSMSR
jgi:hypothetical protein